VTTPRTRNIIERIQRAAGLAEDAPSGHGDDPGMERTAGLDNPKKRTGVAEVFARIDARFRR